MEGKEKAMRIFIASYQTLMLNRGGPSFKTMKMLEGLHKIGVEVKLFNMWDKDLELGENDLVHIFHGHIQTYPLARNLKTYGAKYVVNPIFYSNHSATTIKLYRALEAPFRKVFKRTYSDYFFTKYICDNSEMVLPNTQAEADILNKALGVNTKKLKVIENGVEKRFASAKSDLFKDKYGLEGFILYVGHLGAVRKNGVKIIKALGELGQPAVIIADVLKNKEGSRCLELIDKYNNITYLGWLNHDDPLLASAYKACKVFALPTRYETPGRAALEAGLAGANIVITPHGGTKEYFADMAEYPDPHSISSIKKAVQKALHRKKNDRLKDHILKNYIWDVIVRKNLEIYKKIL